MHVCMCGNPHALLISRGPTGLRANLLSHVHKRGTLVRSILRCSSALWRLALDPFYERVGASGDSTESGAGLNVSTYTLDCLVLELM